jgi:hypothetical protein
MAGGMPGAGAVPVPSVARAGPIRVIEYGDSLSVEAGNFFNFALGPSATVVNRAIGGAAPCTFGDDMFQQAATFRPQAVVIQFSGTVFSACMAGYVQGTLAYYFKLAADTEHVIYLFGAIGARVYVAGYPTGLLRPPSFMLLNQVYAAVAAQYPNAVFIDAGTSVEATGQWTATLPCLYFEPCNVPCITRAVVPGSDCVRSPDTVHFCPDGHMTFTGYTGYCDEWSSGAFRYGGALASGVIRDFGL